MLGLRMHHSGKEFQQGLYKAGVITNLTAGDVIRIVPPYVVTAEQVDAALARMRSVLSSLPVEVKS